MNLWNWLMACLLGLMMSVAIAGTADTYHYKATADNGKESYDLVITPGTFTWTGLTGEDKGVHASSPSQHTNLANAIEVIQWKGRKLHSFNTIIIDHDNLTYVYSGTDGKTSSLGNGHLEKVLN